MNKINKCGSLVSRFTTAVSAGSLIAAVAVYAPQAIAEDSVDMELKIQQMEESLRLMRMELDSVREDNRVQRLDTLEERVTMVEVTDGYRAKNKSMIAFRGGYSELNTNRDGVFVNSLRDINNGVNGPNLNTAYNDSQDGWYIGASIDHSLSDDLFGLWDGAEVFGEIMFQYNQFTSADCEQSGGILGGGATSPCALRIVPAAQTVLGLNSAPNANAYGVQITQFTLSASPKIKFLPDSPVRPWIIPVGLDINVISPPSNGATYINAGMQFAGGVEWNFWNNMVVGADVRYHWSPKINGADPRFWQGGGYVGFLF